MTLTHNGITYEPPVKNRTFKKQQKERCLAIDQYAINLKLKYSFTSIINRYLIQKLSYNAHNRIN